MPVGSANALTAPLGRGMPQPGGDIVQMPRGISEGPQNPAAGPQPRTAGGIGDLPSPQAGARDSFDGSRNTLMQQFNKNEAWYKQTGQALARIDKIRKSLERLSDKQDLVTMDDIVDEAGKLVGHGIDPMALAGMLADAPQDGGGEALGGWVATQAQTAMMGEQRMLMQHNLAQHSMGVSAMHILMAHHNAQAMFGPAAPPIGKSQDQQPSDDMGLGGQPGGQNGNGLSIPQPTPGDTTPGAASALGSRFMENG